MWICVLKLMGRPIRLRLDRIVTRRLWFFQGWTEIGRKAKKVLGGFLDDILT